MSRNFLVILVLTFVLSITVFLLTSGRSISSQKNLGTFLSQNKTTPDTVEAYQFALENPRGVLSKVRCYCGCLRQGHQNNRDCFINDEGGFDLMGLNCGLCVKTALISKQMLAEGKTVQEISDYVDALK